MHMFDHMTLGLSLHYSFDEAFETARLAPQVMAVALPRVLAPDEHDRNPVRCRVSARDVTFHRLHENAVFVIINAMENLDGGTVVVVAVRSCEPCGHTDGRASSRPRRRTPKMRSSSTRRFDASHRASSLSRRLAYRTSPCQRAAERSPRSRRGSAPIRRTLWTCRFGSEGDSDPRRFLTDACSRSRCTGRHSTRRCHPTRRCHVKRRPTLTSRSSYLPHFLVISL